MFFTVRELEQIIFIERQRDLEILKQNSLLATILTCSMEVALKTFPRQEIMFFRRTVDQPHASLDSTEYATIRNHVSV